jgi:hypothetical protein
MEVQDFAIICETILEVIFCSFFVYVGNHHDPSLHG